MGKQNKEAKPGVNTVDQLLTHGAKQFLEYLKTSGNVDDYSIMRTIPDEMNKSSGEFTFGNGKRKIRLEVGVNSDLSPVPGAIEDTPETVLHEGVHAFNIDPKVESRTKKIINLLKEQADTDGFIDRVFGYKPVLPTRWEQGRIDDPFVSTSADLRIAYPGVYSSIMNTRDNIASTVKGAIPEGQSWSGLTKTGAINIDPGYASGQEALAHYISNSSVGKSPQQRRQDIGMQLRDKAVPWEVIENLLNDLGLGREAVKNAKY